MERCYPSAILEQLLTGRLNEPDSDRVRAHVSSCAACQAELDRLSDNPALQAWVPQLRKQLPASMEGPALQRALEVLRTTPAASAAEETLLPPTGQFLPFLASAQQEGDLGTLGPYRIQAELGRGGMGIVFRAQDTTLGRTVALKVLPPSRMAEPLARQRFLREARAAATLRHDHIVVVYQVGEHDETLFLAMEFLEGETLAARLRRQGALSLEEVLQYARETADGLAAAHRAGLVHRDIKPANLWIEARPGRSPPTRLKVLDFGLARPTEPAEALTQAGVVVGTPDYMSPEQASCEKVDHRSDLFSLGCVLYHLTTGVTPFPGAGLRAVLRGVLLETPRAPRELRGDVPPALAQLIERLLAKDPRDRPQSADEVVEALRALESELPKPPATLAAQPRDAAGTRARAKAGPDGPLPGRKRGRLILAAVLGLGLLGLGGARFLPTIAQLFQPERGNSKESAAQLPAVPSTPFALLAQDGRPEQAYPTLAAAVTAAQSGDAIEIRGDGPFLCDPIELGPKDLILRAALGHRPQLQQGRPESPARSCWLHSAGKLVLEGLDLRRYGEEVIPDPGFVSISPPGRLYMAQCRFVIQGPGSVVRSNSPSLQVRRCEFFLSALTWGGLQWNQVPSTDFPENRATVEGCLFFSPPGTASGVNLTYPASFPRFSVEVRNNTFACTQALGLVFGNCSGAEIMAAGRTGRIQLSANVFAATLCIIGHYTLPEWQLMPASKAVDYYPVVFDWRDQGNVYLRGVSLLRARDQPNPLTPQREFKSLADWQKWMGVTERSSVEGAIRFTGVSGKETDLERIHPAHLRLAEDSIGRKAGPDGRDLGADVDAVGPGAAYEAWRKTGDYQQWLKDTGQLKERTLGGNHR
jgi:hypothetical protein